MKEVTEMKKRVIVFGVFILIAASASHHVDAQPKDKATFRLNWFAQGSFAPYFLGLDKGFYAEEGIDLTILEGKGGASTLQLIAAGTDTFAVTDLPAMMKGVDKGLPVVAVMAIWRKNSTCIVSLAESGIKEPKDLAGKSIGASPGSATTKMLPAFLKDNGVNPDSVKIVLLDPQTYPRLFLQRKVDAITGYTITRIPALEDAGEKGAVLEFYNYGFKMIGDGIVVNQKLLRSTPNLIPRFLKATVKAWQYAMKNPDEAVQSLIKHFPMLKGKEKMTRSQLLISFNYFDSDTTRGKPFGWMAKEDWDTTQALQLKFGEIEKAVPVDTYYTNKFVPN